MNKSLINIAIYASGAGSNAQQIIRHFEGSSKAKISLIVCNKPGAGILQIADKEGISTLLIEKEPFFQGNAYIPELKQKGIDLIVLATSTPDNTFPATATAVQRKLGIGPAIAFDLQAVCAGFAYAMATADNFVRAGQARTALVIGAETFSRLLDWQDRGTCVLFGDGAGAVVLGAELQPGARADRGILATHLSADGRHYEDLYVDGGPSSTGTTGHLRMNGREVFRCAVGELTSAALTVLDKAGYAPADLDWLVPHQANKRIIDAVGKRLHVPAERKLPSIFAPRQVPLKTRVTSTQKTPSILLR